MSKVLGKVGVMVWGVKRIKREKRKQRVLLCSDLEEVKRKRAPGTARCEGEKDFSDLF